MLQRGPKNHLQVGSYNVDGSEIRLQPPHGSFYTLSNPWDFNYQAQLVNGGFLVAFNSINPLVGLKKNLGGGFNYFLFSPLPGEMIQFDLCIFFK